MDTSDSQRRADGAQAPMISLVLPVYNGARYLREALDSILAQSFTDFELIAVDDCSTDATPAILAEYAARDARMRVLTNTENRKLPGSLNRGFAEARGRWFSWTSDDNVLRPEMLARLLAVAESDPACDIVHSDYTLIDARGREIGQVEVRPADELVLGNRIGCSFLYRAEVHHALGGFDETLFGLEDYDFWLRAARRFRFVPLHEDLYLYRRHEGSLTDAHGERIRAMTATLMKREIDALEPGPARARAYVNLCCRDPNALRPALLWLALRDDPVAVAGNLGRIGRWLRYAVRLRLPGSGRTRSAAGTSGELPG